MRPARIQDRLKRRQRGVKTDEVVVQHSRDRSSSPGFRSVDNAPRSIQRSPSPEPPSRFAIHVGGDFITPVRAFSEESS
eukprot:scaffold1712_cov261-Pinguiococcus_pyrenoidosus.AAC.19